MNTPVSAVIMTTSQAGHVAVGHSFAPPYLPPAPTNAAAAHPAHPQPRNNARHAPVRPRRAKQLARISTNVYADTGDHSQHSNSDAGSLIVLDDGSIWAMTDAGDQATASAWTDSKSYGLDECVRWGWPIRQQLDHVLARDSDAS
jgi:hypothetical protein